MLKTQPIFIKRHQEVEEKISHFSLTGLLPPGHTLAVNLDTRTLSLLADGPQLIMVQQLSFNEMHVFIPILESFPHYCPYEVLLAHISSNTVTAASIDHCRQRLLDGKKRGTWQQELRPIRRALSPLRNKLYSFGLEVSNIRKRGCGLTSITGTSGLRSSN